MSTKKNKKKRLSKNRKNWLIVPIAVILLIIAALLAYKPVANKGRALAVGELLGDPHAEWLGMYMKGYKVGYVVSKIDTLKDGYRVLSYTYMRINPVSGQEKEVEYLVEARTDTGFDMKGFSFRMVSGDYQFTARGEKRGKKLTIHYTSGGEERVIEKELKLPQLPATLEGLVSLGKTGEFEFYDPTTQSLMKVKVRYTGEGIYGGAKVKQYVIEMQGIEIRFTVTLEGKLLKEELPIGIVMLSEDKEKAMNVEGLPEGLYASYAVKTDRVIRRPRHVSYLKVRLLDADIGELNIQDDRQKLNGRVLTIRTVQPEYNVEIPESLVVYTQTEEFIPCDDPLIVNKAKEIVGDSKGWDAVEKLNMWVYTHLKKKPTFSIPEPVEVLRTMEGDCNEHSALFVALARAAGIPARVEVGLVYFGDGFYYHAWAGVWAGKWVSVDPTFGQNIADATHLKLEQGGFEKQVKLYRVINKLRIEVIEYD